MSIKELKKELMKNQKFRKASEEADRDARWQVCLAVEFMRLKSGWTQKQLARKMKTKQSAISRMENTGMASLETLTKLAKVFKKKIIIKFE